MTAAESQTIIAAGRESISKVNFMTELTVLWLPILLSAVFVFIASSLIHMFTPWHQADHPRLPNEDQVMDALRPLNIPPGDYMVPRCTSRADMCSPEFLEKMKRGPVIVMTVMPNGQMAMGRCLSLWFVYTVVVGVFAAYVAGRALPHGAAYLHVFRFAGTTAFCGYWLALLQMSVWYHRSWGTTFRLMVDGLVYGLLTAGTFGWLWPR